jgi:hypothetical protein
MSEQLSALGDAERRRLSPLLRAIDAYVDDCAGFAARGLSIYREICAVSSEVAERGMVSVGGGSERATVNENGREFSAPSFTVVR